MPDVWIRDEVGRVLGPIGVAVLRDLIAAGRLAAIQWASRDGNAFVPIAQVPEVADLVAREARRLDDQLEAERIWAVIHGLETKAPHEVFELPATSSVEQFKSAFFRLVKHYHPDRLAADAPAELRLAYDSLFHFLAQNMMTVERTAAAAAATASPVVAAKPAARYDAEAFVGLRQRPDGTPEIEVRVTPASVGMFTENDLVNLAKDGVFVPVTQPLSLGSTLELRFVFEERTISARGRVVFENIGGRRDKPGIGLKFVRLADADRAFLIDYVKRIQTSRAPRS